MNDQTQIPPVILRSNRPDELETSTDYLARFMGLLPFGTTYLSRQARYPLRKATWLLVLIFVFDLIAWSILLNLILHRGQFMISLLFIGALFLAFLLSTATLIFEINIFTSDLDWRDPKTWGSVGARAAIIIASAMITAQPLHILFFDGPISHRAQREQATQHAAMITKDALAKLKHNKKLIELEIKIRETSVPKCTSSACKSAEEDMQREETEITTLYKQNSEIKANIDSIKYILKDSEGQKEEKIKAQRKAKSYAFSYGKQIKKSRDENEIKGLKRKQNYQQRLAKKLGIEIKELEDTITEQTALLVTQKSKLDSKVGEIKHHEETRAEYREKYNAAAVIAEAEWKTSKGTRAEDAHKGQKVALAEEALYRDFLMRILTEKLSMGDRYAQEGEDNPLRVFNFQPIDFFERLRIWDDLRHGEPAKWPEGLTEEETNYIVHNFKLLPEPTESELKRLKAEAKSHNFNHYAVLFLGMLLPLLVLLFKLLLPEALKRYYSYDYQAYRGHPEALKFRQFKQLQEQNQQQS